MNLKSLTDKLQGRHTAAAAVFSFVGTILHFYHRLDSSYIQFVGMMMGFIFAHSLKEDVTDKSQAPDANKV